MSINGLLLGVPNPVYRGDHGRDQSMVHSLVCVSGGDRRSMGVGLAFPR